MNEMTAGTSEMVALRLIEDRIATHMQGAYMNLLQVGRCLIQAKEENLVPHGEWEDWVRRNTGMNERSAQRLMQAARSAREGSALERLPVSKIQAILALPEAGREEMAERAVDEEMSLRELKAAVQREKQRADQMAEINERTAARAAANARDAEAALREVEALRERLHAESERARQAESERARAAKKLKDALELAKRATPAAGIGPEARAEIERLKAELAEAEQYAERQAELREQAQREMLAMQSQAARGGLSAEEAPAAPDLAAAVRQFIGAVGVLPHMGAALSRAAAAERRQMQQYVDMVEAWVRGARAALSTVLVSAEDAEEVQRHGQ